MNKGQFRKGHSVSVETREKQRRASTHHGHALNGIVTPTYTSWESMRKRCRVKTNISFKYYGARGIKVCKRWDKFKNFLKDMGVRPLGMFIERMDNYQGYKPSNCKWATRLEQNRNKRKS